MMNNQHLVYQVKNGGALSVSEECAVTFMGTAKFIDNSILIKQLPPVTCGESCVVISKGESYVTKKGGAIHNKVSDQGWILVPQIHTVVMTCQACRITWLLYSVIEWWCEPTSLVRLGRHLERGFQCGLSGR